MTEDTSPGDAPERTAAGDEALGMALNTAAAAEMEPLAMAALNAQLRSSIKGAHAVMHALVTKLAGVGVTVVLPRELWQAPDPQTELDIKTKADGTVEVTVKRKINLAIRRKR